MIFYLVTCFLLFFSHINAMQDTPYDYYPSGPLLELLYATELEELEREAHSTTSSEASVLGSQKLTERTLQQMLHVSYNCYLETLKKLVNRSNVNTVNRKGQPLILGSIRNGKPRYFIFS